MSAISRLRLGYISAVSRLYLGYISQAELLRRAAEAGEAGDWLSACLFYLELHRKAATLELRHLETLQTRLPAALGCALWPGGRSAAAT